jgi:hypothetical protein
MAFSNQYIPDGESGFFMYRVKDFLPMIEEEYEPTFLGFTLTNNINYLNSDEILLSDKTGLVIISNYMFLLTFENEDFNPIGTFSIEDNILIEKRAGVGLYFYNNGIRLNNTPYPYAEGDLHLRVFLQGAANLTLQNDQLQTNKTTTKVVVKVPYCFELDYEACNNIYYVEDEDIPKICVPLIYNGSLSFFDEFESKNYTLVLQHEIQHANFVQFKSKGITSESVSFYDQEKGILKLEIQNLENSNPSTNNDTYVLGCFEFDINLEIITHNDSVDLKPFHLLDACSNPCEECKYGMQYGALGLYLKKETNSNPYYIELASVIDYDDFDYLTLEIEDGETIHSFSIAGGDFELEDNIIQNVIVLDNQTIALPGYRKLRLLNDLELGTENIPPFKTTIKAKLKNYQRAEFESVFKFFPNRDASSEIIMFPERLPSDLSGDITIRCKTNTYPNTKFELVLVSDKPGIKSKSTVKVKLTDSNGNEYKSNYTFGNFENTLTPTFKIYDVPNWHIFHIGQDDFIYLWKERKPKPRMPLTSIGLYIVEIEADIEFGDNTTFEYKTVFNFFLNCKMKPYSLDIIEY